MMTDSFTVKAGEALQAAHRRATTDGHAEMLPLHVLDALISNGDRSDGGGLVRPLLQKAGVSTDQLRSIVDSEMKRLPRASGGGLSHRIS